MELFQNANEDEAWNDKIDFASPYLVNGLPKNKAEELEIKRQIMRDAKKRVARKAKFILACYSEVRISLETFQNQ